jgi:hypothetical protein
LDLTNNKSDAASLIPKPIGEMGKPRLGGYNLQESLGWEDDYYKSVKVGFLLAFFIVHSYFFRTGFQVKLINT